MRPLFLLALLAAISPSASAQTMISAPHFSPGRVAPPSFAGGAHFNRGFPGGFLYPIGFGDSLYSDYLSRTGYPAPPPPVIVTTAPAPPPAPIALPAPAEPLMIELRGDHYVQVSGDARSNAQMIDQMPVAIASAKQPEQISPSRPAPSAVLVFRDGHDEEVSDYTIAGGALYARANYYDSGAWNRKIDLASLNLSETVKMNQARGLRFQLPQFANEVIVGP